MAAAPAPTVSTTSWKTGDKVAIRDGYGKGLLEIGRERADVVALDADLAESTRSHWFAKEFPQRFFQMGISEQDMVVTAAGLAHMGKVPFASSFAIFMQRGWEQIRNCVARQKLNVKFCGSHGGLMTGQDGSSAHALEDVGVMRGLPHMGVVVPCDAVEAKSAVLQMYLRPGPAYMRSTRAAVPVLFEPDHTFTWGKGHVMADGDDAAILANGPQVAEALQARKELQGKGLSVRVVAMGSVKPIDRTLIAKCGRETGFVVSAEDHFIHNGLGSATAECLAGEGVGAKLWRIGVQDGFTQSGDPKDLYRYYGIDAEAIGAAVVGLRDGSLRAPLAPHDLALAH
ncbi:MAG TPA: transketolase C-terminal domain-containing protein [Candidatus Thermoplasmatota archaeon]|nr:transketolase C-terminal domain-containing protein [Candidatus Thermoplasmatota archaeon]